MDSISKTQITVQTIINAPIELVWKKWTTPADIMNWCSASDDWHAPEAENDLKIGGKFMTRMEAKDGSYGFDFEGIYDSVIVHDSIEYSLEDGRKVKILFKDLGNFTEIIETFDLESINSTELQQAGWQSILDNFKKYAEL